MVPKTWRPAARQGISNFDSTVKNIDNVWSKLKSFRLYTMIISRPSSTATFWYYYWITATTWSQLRGAKHNPCTGRQSRAQALLHTRSYDHSPESSHFCQWLKTWNNTFKFFFFSFLDTGDSSVSKKGRVLFFGATKIPVWIVWSPISFKFPPPLSLYRIHTSTINLNFFLHPSFSWTSHWGQVTLILFEIDRILLICKAWVY